MLVPALGNEHADALATGVCGLSAGIVYADVAVELGHESPILLLLDSPRAQVIVDESKGQEFNRVEDVASTRCCT